MPAPPDGDAEPRGRKTSVLRGAGFSAAVVLGVIAIWLIVTSSSQKRIEIGVLTGLWGLLLGAFSVFGSRHPLRGDQASAPSGDVAVRGGGELERAQEAQARREFEARLEHLLRREIQTSMQREVSTLREEVSSLRTELLDKVGGQLRLERIETTRVIGSDIEAIKREVNQLKGTRLHNESDRSTETVTRITSAQVVEQSSAQVVEQSSVVDQAVVPEPVAPPAQAPRPERVASPAPAPPAQSAATEPDDHATPEPAISNEPFAGLPRLSPFTDFELDPIEPTPEPEPDYSGRRRADGASEPTGRHGEDSVTDSAVDTGRRRRHTDAASDDVLSRILQRESTR